MFNRIAKGLLGLITLNSIFSVSVYASPYYRFWQGWKLEEFSQERFYSAINQIFIPATVKTGIGKGLNGYLPVLPKKVLSGIPDEVALVVYESEEVYKSLRETPEGKEYGELHWKFFDKNKGSKSSVAQVFQGKLEKQRAYDILNSNADWQKGHALYTMIKLNGDVEGYVSSLKERARTIDLNSYVVLVADDFFIEYQLWQNRGAFEKASNELSTLKKQFSISKPFSNAYLRHSEQPTEENIKEGEGINSLFSDTQTKHPVINGDPISYAEKLAAAYAEGMSDTTPFGSEGCEQVNNSTQSPIIDCQVTTTVLVFGGHPATSSFICRYWFEEVSRSNTYYFIKEECPIFHTN